MGDAKESTPLIQKSSKSDEQQREKEGTDKGGKKPPFYMLALAYGLGFFSMMISSFSITCVQWLGGSVPEFELNVWRFGTQTLLAVPLVARQGVGRLRIPRAGLLPFSGVIVMYVAYNTTFYTAPQYLPVGTMQGMTVAVTLICNVISSVCVVSERSTHLYVSTCVCVLGIVLLTQPLFLFGHATGLTRLPTPNWTSPCLPQDTILSSPHDNQTLGLLAADKTNNQDDEGGLSDEAIGYILVILSGALISFGLFVINRSMKHMTSVTFTFWVGVFGATASACLMLGLETPSVPSSPACIGYLLAHALGTAQSSFIIPFCMSYVMPSVFGLIISIKLVTMLIFQYTWVSHIRPGLGNWLEIFGAVICFVGSTLGPMYQLYQEKKAYDREKLKTSRSSDLLE